MAKKDYYETLGLSKTATDAEIKSAFRKLAKQYHPDVNKEPGAAEKFKEIGEAYAVLSDPDKRRKYDQYGSAAFDNNMGGGFQGFGGGGFQDFNGFDFGDIDLSDIIDSLMGGGGRRRNTKNRSSKGADMLVRLSLTFNEAVFGTEKTFSIDVLDKCPDCNGLGGTNPSTCSHCHGRGRVISEQHSLFGTIQTETTCPYCKGTGEEFKNVCSTCRGKGTIKHNKDITLRVPSGVEDKDQMRLAGKGSAGENGGPNGDVYVEFSVSDHPLFKRDGKDIYLVVPLTITEATLGCTKEIPSLDGTFSINIPAGTQNNENIKLKGKGINSEKLNKVGDMFVITNVIIPTKLDRNQKALFNDLDETTLDNEDAFKKFKKYL